MSGDQIDGDKVEGDKVGRDKVNGNKIVIGQIVINSEKLDRVPHLSNIPFLGRIDSGKYYILFISLFSIVAITLAVMSMWNYYSSQPVVSPFFDTSGGPIRTAITLENGIDYQITISGTWSTWEASWWSSVCKGIPEAQPRILSPNRENGNVGLDAAFIFARPKRSEYCGQLEHLPTLFRPFFRIVTSLNNGTSWQTLIPDNPVYNPEHVYIYTLQGKGFPAQFKLEERSPQDNYGILTILVKNK